MLSPQTSPTYASTYTTLDTQALLPDGSGREQADAKLLQQVTGRKAHSS